MSSEAINRGAYVAEIHNVSQRFGPTYALRNVSFLVQAGEVVALLGPNGAGKTSLFDLLLGLARPSQGAITLFGYPPQHPEARRALGSTLQHSSFPETLTSREVVRFVQAHYPKHLGTEQLLRDFGLESLKEKPVGGLSGGQQRSLAVALAFAGCPKLVLLDEPTVGLDAEARRRLWRVIKRYAEAGGSVLLATHYFEEAEQLSDRVILLYEGKVITDNSLENLKAKTGGRLIRFNLGDESQLGLLDDLNTESTHLDSGEVKLYATDADLLVRELCARDIRFSNLTVSEIALEEMIDRLLAAERP